MSRRGVLLSVLRMFSCAGNEQDDLFDEPLVRQRATPGRADDPSSAAYASRLGGELDLKKSCIENREDSAQEGSLFMNETDGLGHQGYVYAEQQLQALLMREHMNSCIRNWPHSEKAAVIKTRAKLLAWLRQATIYHDYSLSTLEHAVNFLDRYLSKTLAPDGKAREMELAAVAAFSIACKMEEVYLPSLASDLQAASPWPHFLPVMIERMELNIMQALDWRMACVTPADLVEPILEGCTAWQRHGSGWAEAPHDDGAPKPHAKTSLELPLTSLVHHKAFGILAASFADPELTNFTAAEVAAGCLTLAVHGLCWNSVACAVQSCLLSRFPKMAACLPALLQYCTISKQYLSFAAAASQPCCSSAEAAATAHSPSHTPVAKRTRRANSPSSVLGGEGLLASPDQICVSS